MNNTFKRAGSMEFSTKSVSPKFIRNQVKSLFRGEKSLKKQLYFIHKSTFRMKLRQQSTIHKTELIIDQLIRDINLLHLRIHVFEHDFHLSKIVDPKKLDYATQILYAEYKKDLENMKKDKIQHQKELQINSYILSREKYILRKIQHKLDIIKQLSQHYFNTPFIPVPKYLVWKYKSISLLEYITGMEIHNYPQNISLAIFSILAVIFLWIFCAIPIVIVSIQRTLELL